MDFQSQLTQGVLLKRYKRYLAEIILNNQEHRIIYCPNMGVMSGCENLGSRIWFSHTHDSRRPFPDTWELVEVDGGHLICVNTQHVKPILIEAIEKNKITELRDYTQYKLILPYLEEEGFDFILEKNISSTLKTEKCFGVMKAVTLGDEIHRGFYPEAANVQNSEQLKALISAKQRGHRAILIYGVLHTGVQRVFPADHIDPEYGALLRQALITGVEIIGYRVDISLIGLFMGSPVEICIPARLISSSRST